MERTCECGHSEDDHGHDPQHPGSTACRDDDCTCIAFEWDHDEGGAAVTRSKMRTMGDPDYVYRPLSPEQRQRLSEIHLARFAPKGMRSVYGVIVPERHQQTIVKIARFLRNPRRGREQESLESTQQIVRELLQFLEENFL